MDEKQLQKTTENAQPEKRKQVSKSVIFQYWRDKAITKDGKIIPDDGKYHEDQIPVVEYVNEPRCFACGCPVHGLDDVQIFNHIDNGKPLGTLWNRGTGIQKCHIVPHQAGGADEASNLFLMCARCHEESPDTIMPELFFRWVYKKRHEFPHTLVDHDLDKIVEEVMRLCEELGKDPHSGDFAKMPKAFTHGTRISDSSLVYSYVESCKPKNS